MSSHTSLARRSSAIAGIAGAVAVAAAPAAAAAPTLVADRPCYATGDLMTFSGGGYTPGGTVAMLFGVTSENGSAIFAAVDPTPADAAGAIIDRFEAFGLPSDRDTRAEVTVTANDQTRIEAGAPIEEQFGTTTFVLSAFGIRLERRRLDPRGRMTVRAAGFTNSRRLYLHYVFGGKRRATVALGAVRGPCGDLTARVRQFPMDRPAAGTWELYVSSGRRSYGRRDEWARDTVRVPRR